MRFNNIYIVKKIVKHDKQILKELDENIKVYPGHGEKTSIGYEKKYNAII